MDPAASLPVQIYIWAESAERGFVEKVFCMYNGFTWFFNINEFICPNN